MKEESVPATPGPTALSEPLIRAMVQEFYEFSKKSTEMQALMRKHGFVIDNLEDRWQKLAFTLYSEIAEMAWKSEFILENYKAETNPELAEGPALPESNPIPNPREGAKP